MAFHITNKPFYVKGPMALLMIAGIFFSAAVCHGGTCDGHPSPAVALALNKASTALEDNKPEEALALLIKASKRAGKRSHHLLEFHLGVQLVEAQQPEKALTHFRRATTLCDTYAPAWQNLGRVAYETQRYSEAADALGQAFFLTEETRPSLRYFEALARYKEESWESCVSLCLDLFTRFPEIHNVDWIELATAAASPAKKRPEVIDALTSQIARMGEKPRFRRALANLLLQEKRFGEAMVQFRNLDHLGALTDGELMTLGDLLRMDKLPLDAARCYHRLADKGKSSAVLARKEAETLMAGFQPQKARDVLENAVKTWDTPRLWLLTGQLRFEANDFSGAAKAFRQVLTLRPKHPHALMMLGYSLFQQDNPEEALIWLEKAVKLCPKGSAKTLRDYVARHLDTQKKAKPQASGDPAGG
ncbi:tetratricopeptide repeat protein [Desulfoluna sp.]|uniref:tetratricopeptide repeat protein n=1 Tax=Desulfoluna sp. TaxID=2045199 RepID=UPI00261F67AC|nr:tetratricopeptide repeat protein [Desulfoluna sp.]